MEAAQPIRTVQTVVVNDQPIPVTTGNRPVLTTIINDKPFPVQVTNIPSAFEYKVDQIWSGWWGGWGNNSTLDKRLNSLAQDGWRMIDSRSTFRFWWWFLPRPKILLFFEREKGS